MNSFMFMAGKVQRGISSGLPVVGWKMFSLWLHFVHCNVNLRVFIFQKGVKSLGGLA